MSANWGLALHTTTDILGLALMDSEQECREHQERLGLDLSNLLLVRMRDFLPPQSLQDLAFVAVANGPGSFTSTRVGLVVARTLGQQLAIPVFTISSLASLAARLTVIDAEDVVIAVHLDARRNERYGAIYHLGDEGMKPIVAEAIFDAERWHALLETYHPDQVIDGGEQTTIPVRTLAQMAWQRYQQGERPLWNEAVANYMRQPPINTQPTGS
jgi:tRNA threonylcarbamoyl adenosine modification protein YeaZ